MDQVDQFRLFVSLALPEEVKDRVQQAQNELRRVLPGPNFRWSRREQFHLTLRFLGDVEATRVEALKEALQAACRELPPLQLRACGIGCFPDLRRPRVLWAGVSDAGGELLRLQQLVQAASDAFTSEKKEERFTGHVTLARLKDIRRAEVERLPEAVEGMRARDFGEWTTTSIELMRSELTPQGARHTVLAEIALAGAKV
jgi:RNA 2',3'-cyclic 3'-phosphodiesterase